MVNNKIVPGQWAEYWASSVLPVNPKPTEYNKQAKAIIIGYHFRIKSFILSFYLNILFWNIMTFKAKAIIERSYEIFKLYLI